MKKFVFALLMAVSFNVHAAMTEENFGQLIEDYGNSRNAFEEKEVTFDSLNGKVQKAIKKAADEAADIWGDTVLEGPYNEVNGAPLVIDYVLEVYKNGKLVAYYATFSRKAYFTDACDIDADKVEIDTEEAYKDCPVGSIVDHVFVSADLKFAREDWNNPADWSE